MTAPHACLLCLQISPCSGQHPVPDAPASAAGRNQQSHHLRGREGNAEAGVPVALEQTLPAHSLVLLPQPSAVPPSTVLHLPLSVVPQHVQGKWRTCLNQHRLEQQAQHQQNFRCVICCCSQWSSMTPCDKVWRSSAHTGVSDDMNVPSSISVPVQVFMSVFYFDASTTMPPFKYAASLFQSDVSTHTAHANGTLLYADPNFLVRCPRSVISCQCMFGFRLCGCCELE